MAETEKNWKISIGWLGKKPDGYPDWLLNTLAGEIEEKLEERAKYFEQKKKEILAEFEKQSHLMTIGRETQEMTLRQAATIVFKEWRNLEGDSHSNESYKKAKEDLLDYLFRYFKESADRKLLVIGLNDRAIEAKTRIQDLEENKADDYELSRSEREYQELNEFAHFISILLKIEIT